MARAYPQSQPSDYQRNGGDWQSLRQELVALLDRVDGEVTRSRRGGYAEPEDAELDAPAHAAPENRHRDALRSVQRQLSRFEEAGALPPNPRDSLEAAISQIRSRQGAPRAAMPAPTPQPAPAPRENTAVLEKLALSVNGLSGRLEKLEGEIHTQLKSGADVKDVADQVAQLAHVVELLAGAVGETGQVKRLEGQIASLGRIISQGRDIDSGSVTRRLDDIAETMGKLAELQVHYADKVENPVASQAFRDGMRAIEDNVRNVYDRIDSLERSGALQPTDLDQVTAQMARFVEAVREHSGAPQGLVELIDALNLRIADIEGGDRLLQGLRKDLGALRESVVVSLAPRFDAIEQRMDGLSTREDMAEIGRQIGALSDRLGEQPADGGVGQLEAQVRQLVARMDQTGEQLANLARLHTEPSASTAMPDFGAMADLVAERTAAAVERSGGQALTDTLNALESRISAMLSEMPHDREVGDVSGMQAGISEVNERLRRLEDSLMARASAPMPPAPALPQVTGLDAILAEAEQSMPRPRDMMPRSPAADAPLVDAAFPEPAGPVADALEAKSPRKRHPGLEADVPLAARYEAPAKTAPSSGFAATKAEVPPAPRPSLDFSVEPAPVEDAPEVSAASTNTFIAAARRAAQRQQQATPKSAPPASGSLMGRALSRFHVGGDTEPAAAPEAVPPAERKTKRKAAKADKAAPVAVVANPSPEAEPTALHQNEGKPAGKAGFLARNRRAILLGVAVAVIAALAINLVVQRLLEPTDPEATATPATTGDIASPADTAAMDALASTIPPRIIPTDETQTGAIDHGVSPAFTNSPVQPMPSTFSAQPVPDATSAPQMDALAEPPATPATDTDGDGDAAADVANVDPSAITPADIEPAPSTEPPAPPAAVAALDLPPEKVGPIALRQAAANGDPRAQFEVAAIYSEGRAVPQDFAAAATWYQHAAEQGFAPAEYRLGSLYESGKGVTKDLKAAETWYEKAAEAGNRMSMHNLASLYAGGQMGPQQFDKAAKWFEQAANLGLVDSQFNLGMLYARGLGVTQSLQDSFKWFSIAARSGDKDSAKARDDIARSLDAATVAKLTADVNAFKPGSIDIATNFAPIGTWSEKFDPGETIAAHDIVQSVQKALNKLGYDVGTPDGIAGKKTADAIKSFEAATGMSQVGLINPRLLAVLGSQPV